MDILGSSKLEYEHDAKNGKKKTLSHILGYINHRHVAQKAQETSYNESKTQTQFAISKPETERDFYYINQTKAMRISTMFSLNNYSSAIKTTPHSSAFFSSSLHSFPLQTKSRNYVSLKESSFPGNPISTKRQHLSVVSGSKSDNGFQQPCFQVRSDLRYISFTCG